MEQKPQLKNEKESLESPRVGSSVEQQLGDGAGLLKGAAKLALQMGARLLPETLEKQGLTLLRSERVKPKLLQDLQEALEQMGLFVTLQDLVFETGSAAEARTITGAHGAEPNSPTLPDAIADALMDEFAAWLRDGLRASS